MTRGTVIHRPVELNLTNPGSFGRRRTCIANMSKLPQQCVWPPAVVPQVARRPALTRTKRSAVPCQRRGAVVVHVARHEAHPVLVPGGVIAPAPGGAIGRRGRRHADRPQQAPATPVNPPHGPARDAPRCPLIQLPELVAPPAVDAPACVRPQVNAIPAASWTNWIPPTTGVAAPRGPGRRCQAGPHHWHPNTRQRRRPQSTGVSVPRGDLDEPDGRRYAHGHDHRPPTFPFIHPPHRHFFPSTTPLPGLPAHTRGNSRPRANRSPGRARAPFADSTRLPRAR